MSDQKCWDAALIKIWRTNGLIVDALALFTALTNKHIDECDPPLKRLPPPGMPYKIHVRVFVYGRLPKINDRLWAQTPDKDVLLLRKLETSSYDTLSSEYNRDPGLDSARKHINRSLARIEAETNSYRDRNSDTDWGTVKAHTKKQRRRK